MSTTYPGNCDWTNEVGQRSLEQGQSSAEICQSRGNAGPTATVYQRQLVAVASRSCQTANYVNLLHKFVYIHSAKVHCPQIHCAKQEARLSQTDRATLRVTEYFAKSLKAIGNDTVEQGVCKCLLVFD